MFAVSLLACLPLRLLFPHPATTIFQRHTYALSLSPSFDLHTCVFLFFIFHAALLVIISLLRFVGCGRFASTLAAAQTSLCHAQGNAKCSPVYSVSDHITNTYMRINICTISYYACVAVSLPLYFSLSLLHLFLSLPHIKVLDFGTQFKRMLWPWVLHQSDFLLTL